MTLEMLSSLSRVIYEEQSFVFVHRSYSSLPSTSSPVARHPKHTEHSLLVAAMTFLVPSLSFRGKPKSFQRSPCSEGFIDLKKGLQSEPFHLSPTNVHVVLDRVSQLSFCHVVPLLRCPTIIPTRIGKRRRWTSWTSFQGLQCP